MKSNYSENAINWIKTNYEEFIKKEEFTSISVGGSVARGYAQKNSDIDLICISMSEKKYKKIFKNENGFPIEIHIIPIEYIYALIANIKKYTTLDCLLPNSIDIFSMGAKKCTIIERKLNPINKLLSDWREIKKITDSIILYEDSNEFLTNLKKKISNTKISKNIISMWEENMEESSKIEQIITMLKLYSMYIGKVYSKVLWTDYYLENDYNKNIKTIILNSIKIDEEIIKKFYDWQNKEYNNLINEHSKINCEFCKNDYLQCNIMRCIRDYSNDAKKARDIHLKLGEILSIKKSMEYIFLLLNHLKIEDEELIDINSKIEINDEEIKKIWKEIKGECIKYASKQ